MTYSIMTEADIDYIATLYTDYYNNHEDGCWTYKKSYKRIQQIVTIVDFLHLIQWDDSQNVTGMAIG